MNVLLNGRRGKVGSVLGPGLEAAGHTLVDALDGADAMVDFTRPDAVAANVRAAVDAGVPSVVGTTGWDIEEFRDAPVTVFYAPNFALGAVLMMRFAAEAAQAPRAGGDRRAAPRGEGRRCRPAPRSSPRSAWAAACRSTRCACPA